MPYGRIRSIEEIERVVPNFKNKSKIIVTTNGSFDLIHGAHARLLNKAKELGDYLIVLLNSDESIKRNKGPQRPIIPEIERAYMLSELKAVDYVVIFPQDKPLEYLARIKPDVHVKGGSVDNKKLKEEIEFIENLGGEYKIFELEHGLSTTNIIQKILDAYKN
ncbi:adenylyltransferase/cytidyltransferase family protein [Candidatus Pacearchaeota archaeon]|nr:adenylyltransferase/cytidyltransferase family protein [Candidatus Pacearchaeota archaeon]